MAMATTILTLFGEEIVPEEVKAVGRRKATLKEPAEPKEPKKRKKRAAEEPVEGEQVVETAIDGQIEDEVAVVAEETAVKPTIDDKFADWTGDKKYYSIGEVAKLFGVRTSNIRYWTNEFALKVRTTRKGDRLYTPEQVKEIRTIYHLVKERRFTISGAKKKLKEGKNVSVQSVDLKDSLLQLRNKLVQLKNSLE